MEKRNLSKLQIRSEVVSLLQHIASFGDDIPVAEQNKALIQLKSVENLSDVLEFLLKEFPKSDYKIAKVITFFMLEIGTLDAVKDTLWGYLKGDVADNIKDLVCITLRGLGDSAEPEEYLNCLDNPEEIIDKETQKLLETSLINPEAQIDFLDFLFSLPENEQLNLIVSLKEDYTGESLANILIPALETRPSYPLEELIIETLGHTRTEIAVSSLIDVEKYSPDDKFRKLARKSLNMLKLSGINIDNANINKRGNKLCAQTEIYQCFSSLIDGMGNQGIIFCRQKENQDVIMFSAVINDIEGIVDCFGFYGIGEHDLTRIISRFQGDAPPIFVSPEYCKTRLMEAELINKINNKPIPYEYTAWKTLLADVAILTTSVEDVVKHWVNVELKNEGDSLYQHPDFKHWFIEESDHPDAELFINKMLDNVINNYELYSKDINILRDYLEDRISDIIPKVFDKNWREIYYRRLINTACLLDSQEIAILRDVAASVAMTLKPDSGFDIIKSTFIRGLFKKTVIEALLRYQEAANPTAKPQPISTVFAKTSEKKESPKFDFEDIINKLTELWG